jgi:hypothetical protein
MGPTGPSGVGSQGPTGATGPTGPQGLIGPTGPSVSSAVTLYDGDGMTNEMAVSGVTPAALTFTNLKNYGLIVMLGYKNGHSNGNGIIIFSPAALDAWGNYTVALGADNWQYNLKLWKPGEGSEKITWATQSDYGSSYEFTVHKVYGIGRV